MAQLVVRGLDKNLTALLQQRASRHGQSMEEEVRDILREVLKDAVPDGEGLGTRISRRFALTGLNADEMIPELRGEHLSSPFGE